MASNRLMLNQVEEIYKKGKVSAGFEPIKVDDLIEAYSHLAHVKHIIETAINAMYDLLQHTYTDAVIQKSRRSDESSALTDMVDRSGIEQALLLADRNYESYNNLAHLQEKGWYFLIRIKNNTKGITS